MARHKRWLARSKRTEWPDLPFSLVAKPFWRGMASRDRREVASVLRPRLWEPPTDERHMSFGTAQLSTLSVTYVRAGLTLDLWLLLGISLATAMAISHVVVWNLPPYDIPFLCSSAAIVTSCT